MEGVISEIVQNIWSTLLSLDLEPASGLAEERLGRTTPKVTGCIQITGAWKGTVLLQCSARHARDITHTWLQTSDVTSQDVHDVIGELVNIIGGNVKALLPAESQLSLPIVAEGDDYELSIHKSRPPRRVCLTCRGEPILVQLLERHDLATAERRLTVD